MTAFTIFFCGTGSNSYDFANTDYFAGELISTLAMNHAGHEFAEWIIVDGPGSGNIQEAQKWVPAGNYMDIRGKLNGNGWEENVQHAVAVLIGGDYEERTKQTRSEKSLLRKAGVGVQEVERTGTISRRLFGDTKEVKHDFRARISPQALQQKKIEILRKKKPITHVNVIGWSRGGVTCHMFANALAQTRGWSHIPVNIFACDPVPGAGNFDTHRIRLGSNVANYVAIYASDERSMGFAPVLPSLSSKTEYFITTMPGRHGTLVGNAAIDGSSGVNTFFGPGKVTRDLAERFLRSWGDQPEEDAEPVGVRNPEAIRADACGRAQLHGHARGTLHRLQSGCRTRRRERGRHLEDLRVLHYSVQGKDLLEPAPSMGV